MGFGHRAILPLKAIRATNRAVYLSYGIPYSVRVPVAQEAYCAFIFCCDFCVEIVRNRYRVDFRHTYSHSRQIPHALCQTSNWSALDTINILSRVLSKAQYSAPSFTKYRPYNDNQRCVLLFAHFFSVRDSLHYRYERNSRVYRYVVQTHGSQHSPPFLSSSWSRRFFLVRPGLNTPSTRWVLSSHLFATYACPLSRQHVQYNSSVWLELHRESA